MAIAAGCGPLAGPRARAFSPTTQVRTVVDPSRIARRYADFTAASPFTNNVTVEYSPLAEGRATARLLYNLIDGSCVEQAGHVGDGGVVACPGGRGAGCADREFRRLGAPRRRCAGCASRGGGRAV